MLEVGREREALSEREQRLVRGEAGPERRDLDEDATRLAEVDRAEVEAVDHRRGVHAEGAHALTPGLVILVGRGERDVMHGSGTRDSAAVGQGVERVEA